MDRGDGVKVKGKGKSKGSREKTEQGERQRDRERSRRGERERKREQRTDNASGVVPCMFPSYGTLTVVLPAQPAMIKYLQHVEKKEARTLKMIFEEKEQKKSERERSDNHAVGRWLRWWSALH